ncbi:DUF2827 family protein [Methylobacterium persicinum]|jgi:Protein of unknown function (DUF2827)|uniref:DUF2827 domain-containing protein n=1 Tax=Methylobacterium persicinum TaxID=374426 RepID=A0ABU0HS80_9HYPH|nr:DUF2827 family protein [Methylobacterium persicinum]MDQ0445190.1 hypothetical protein [Methylobacterium persicinum]GJE39100.1 hypothetical protein KHHGKMAE_3179 [Methylobacterium persicinum]
MRIGITIMTGERQNVWNNGLVQNIFHFAGLMAAIPFVEAVYLIDCGDTASHPEGADADALKIPLISVAEAYDAVDVAIEMGGAIDTEWISRFRFRGGKFILHLCGQPYVSLIEPTVFGRDGFFIDPERFEEIWLLAKDMVFAPMLRSIHQCPVYKVPYLWAPRFLVQTMLREQDGALQFGYRPGSLEHGNVRPAIFEPNISPIKMGLIPYLICDLVERSCPAIIDKVSHLNGDVLEDHSAYIHFISNSSLYKAQKTIIMGRDYFAHVMGRGANMVVSHQIRCEQNYLYLDALYGSYPLIHNSKVFRDVGYYCDDSDVQAGAKQFLDAVMCHDRNLANYQNRARSVIASLAPTARTNVDHYARRLVNLTNQKAKQKWG